MDPFAQHASAYLAALHGADRENAYHRLIELGSDVVPLVTRSFQQESDVSIRALLVNIAWHANSSGALPLLKEALNDNEPSVWKEALDGLVTLGGPTAIDVIRQALVLAKAEKAEWLDEAIKQAR